MYYLFLSLLITQILSKTISVNVVHQASTAWILSGDVSGTNVDIQMAVGDILTISLNTIAFHPFSIHTVNDAGTGVESTAAAGFSFANGVKNFGGVGVANFIPTTTGTFWYVCVNHVMMAGRVIVTSAANPTPVVGPTPTRTPTPTPTPNAPSICLRYAAALSVSQNALMGTIVDTVLTYELANSTVAAYFNGIKPPASTNFTSPNSSTRLTNLRTGLINFFGKAIGCTETPAYTGAAMDVVHKNMQVSLRAFLSFNQVFDKAIASLGVSQADRTAIQGVLASTQTAIVDSSICARYSDALGVTEPALMSTIVNTVLTAELNVPAIKVYFNGQKPQGSTDFTATASSARLSGLKNGLITFFAPAVGCTGVAPYTGTRSQKAIHEGMGITLEDFNQFNDVFIAAIRTLGVTVEDSASIRGVLNGFSAEIVNGVSPVGSVLFLTLLSVFALVF